MKWSGIKGLDPQDRPREKLAARGAAALSDAELLAVILGTGTRGKGVLEVAEEVVVRSEGRLEAMTVSDLQGIAGLGVAKACQIVAAFELGRRRLLGERACVREAKDVLPFIEEIRDKRQEYFVCLSLNGANEVLARRVVTIGLLDSSQVHPREVFADPLTDRAASVVFAHNHPSGALRPSAEDLALTERLVRAGELLGIRVLDHLIVTERGHVSLKQQGRL